MDPFDLIDVLGQVRLHESSRRAGDLADTLHQTHRAGGGIPGRKYVAQPAAVAVIPPFEKPHAGLNGIL